MARHTCPRCKKEFAVMNFQATPKPNEICYECKEKAKVKKNG